MTTAEIAEWITLYYDQRVVHVLYFVAFFSVSTFVVIYTMTLRFYLKNGRFENVANKDWNLCPSTCFWATVIGGFVGLVVFAAFPMMLLLSPLAIIVLLPFFIVRHLSKKNVVMNKLKGEYTK